MSIQLSDRVKELSFTVGTGNMILNGAAVGFSSFGSQYQYNDYLFYAITDGTNYEIGSGQYILDSSNNALKRFPFRSSINNQLINFGQGLKEVYVTYPATHSVYNGSGILSEPQNSGLAFWGGSNILDYDSNLLWDKHNHRLGINTNPQYAIDIGGYGPNSIIRSSGLIVGSSGIYFPPANNENVEYIGGRQLVHFEPNELGDANIESIIELSGLVDNIFLLKKQNAGLVFAGPPSGCSPPCSPALPSFRPLLLMDIEEAVEMSGIFRDNITTVSGIVDGVSGVLRTDLTTVSGIAGVLRTDLTTVSGIAGVLRTDLTTVSGIAKYDNQIRATPSGLSFRLNTANSNLNPLTNIGSLVSLTVNDNTIRELDLSCGILSQIVSVQKTEFDDSTCAIYASTNTSLSGDIIGGTSYGMVLNNLRNTPIDIVDNKPIIVDSGRLKQQNGIVCNYGTWPSGYLSPVTDTCAGIAVGLIVGSGTIVSGIDIFLTNNDISDHAPNTSFPQNHFGIYQNSQNPEYKNYFVGKTGFKTTSPTKTLDIADNTIRLRSSRTITNSNDPGEVGEICWDSNYIYVCIATNTWRRSAISNWP